MAPSSKQADRKAQKKAGKVDDEPATAAGDLSGSAILAAAKQLALGSVLVELSPMLPLLFKKGSEDANKKEVTEEKKDQDEGDTEPSNDAVKDEGKTKDAASIFDDLSARLPFYNPLGLDKAPEEAWLMFKSLEVDFGPYKRKKGNATMERIMVNVERNMAQYVHIVLALMCLRCLAFRSWFACLPWLVGYQFLSLSLPMELIRDTFPQVPPVELKFRVAATVGIHALVWLFFLYEALSLWMIPIILLLVVHAYVVVPEVNPEVALSAISEKLAAKAAETEPPVAGQSNASTIVAVAKQVVMCSVLVKTSPMLIDLVKEMKASSSKTATKSAETQEGEKEEKSETDQKKEEDKKEDTKTSEQPKDATSIFANLIANLSIYNTLGLGLPASPESAKESWLMLKGLQLDFGPQSKKSGAIKDRIMVNFARNMPQYLHIVFGMMCLRSFVFRSWFACLPWLVGYQLLSLNLPLDVIRAKFPQVPPVDFKIRVLVTMGLHAFMWLFFVYEAIYKTYLLEKILLVGLFVSHAYVVSPVPN